jgi:uncharacterized protein YbjT (DUF2867 family)
MSGESGTVVGVFGTTGRVGRAVVETLLSSPVRARAVSINTSRAAPAGVFRASPERAGSLQRAVDGCRSVFLCTRASHRLARHEMSIVDACRAAGVRHVVKLSSIAAGEPSDPAGAHHRAVEIYLEESFARGAFAGVTVLRAPTFTSTFTDVDDPRSLVERLRSLPSDATLNLVDPADLGRHAAAALVADPSAFTIERIVGPETPMVADILLALRRSSAPGPA